jgi:hypothetical protein
MARDLDLNGVRVPKSLQLYDAEGTKADSWARILMLGPAKAGKTVACALTSPKPVFVINCDGEHALIGAAALAAEYSAVDVTTGQQWMDAIGYATSLAAEGKVQTIVVDTLTLLADNLVDDFSRTMSGFDLWGAVKEYLVGGVRDLKQAEAHLIVTAHALANEDSIVGVLPAIPGKAGTRIPAMLHDWVWLDIDTKTEPAERRFLVGPQKNWNHGARNAKRSISIKADVIELFKELGIEP